MAEKKGLQGRKRYFLILIGIGVLVVLVFWANPASVYESFKNADLTLVLIAVLLNVSTIIVMLARWIILYQKEAPQVPYLDSCKIYVIGQATNQVAPMGSGEIARGWIGLKVFKVHFSKTLVAAVIERMVDILFFLILAMICFTIFIPGAQFILQMIIFLIFAALGIIFVLRPQTMDGLFLKLQKLFEDRGKFLSKISTKLIASWETFKSSMYSYHQRKPTLFATGALTVIIWMMDGVTQFVLFRAFGIYIPYYYVLGIASASFIIGALSFLPGGIGAREGSFAYLTALVIHSITSMGFAEGKAVGLAVALAYKSIVYIVMALNAAVALATLPKIKDDDNGKKTSK